MDSAPVARIATPNPGLPRTIGTMNLVFGFLFLLCGAGCFRVAGVLPSAIPPLETRETAREMRRRFLDDVRQREASARSESEKVRLRGEREQIETRQESVEGRVDFPTVDRGFNRLRTYLWCDVVSGAVMNALMFVSGIGLVRLTAWGLRLGVWVARLKIVRLVVLATFLIGFAIPAWNRGIEEFKDTDIVVVTCAQMRVNQQSTLNPGDFVAGAKQVGYIAAVVWLSLAVVYPVIALVVLTRPAATAAVARNEVPS